MESFSYTKSVITKGFDMDQIQKIIMYDTSDNKWEISSPQLKLIQERLANYNTSNEFDIYLRLSYSFDRPVNKTCLN